MSKINQVQKTLGTKLAELLKRVPQNYDVTFCVGPDKVKVKAVKIILKAVSPVFEAQFEEKWDGAVVKEDEGIPLPDADPIAFELFVNLITSDSWTVNALTSLNLPPNTLLNLLGLCRRFQITDAVNNLEEAAKDFIQSFCNFKDTYEFLELSRENLESVFSFEEIPLDEKEIFECACRWAEFHCKEKKMELTGENFREVLGDCLFEIRFPTMKLQDFTKVSLHKKSVLADDTKLAIYDYIGMEEAEKAVYNKTKLFPFRTNPRGTGVLSGCKLLRAPAITTDQPFVCNGSAVDNKFQMNQRISLQGIGFLGPIDEDTYYDVTVRIQRLSNGSWSFDSGTFIKKIFARKGKSFYFLFDKAVTMEPYPYDSSWNYAYWQIGYTLKGAKSVTQLSVGSPAHKTLNNSDAEFYLFQSWNGKPMAELVYKKI